MKRLILPLALLLTVNVTLAESPKVSSDLQEIQEGTSVDVVVQYKKSLSEKQIEKVNNGIGKALGKKEKVRLHVVKGAVYSLQKSEIESLAADTVICGSAVMLSMLMITVSVASNNASSVTAAVSVPVLAPGATVIWALASIAV